MAITQASLYVTSDGKEFRDEALAGAHEKSLTAGKSIDDYIVAAGLVKAGAGLARKHIAAYLSFMDKYKGADQAQAALPLGDGDPS